MVDDGGKEEPTGGRGTGAGGDPPAPKPKAKAKPKPKARAKKDVREPGLWFRVSTRVRAAGYWVREKLQAVWRKVVKGAHAFGDFWQQRSLGERIGIAAAAALLFLVLLVRIVPVPGVPCQISVKECAPEQRTFELVPADALMYAHLTIDEGSDQFERSGEAFDKLGDLRTILTAELPGALPAPSGEPIDVRRDVLPWAERDLAVSLMPGPGRSSLPAFMAGISDRGAAEEFLRRIAPSDEPRNVTVGDVQMTVYEKGFAAAIVGDTLLFGREPAVRASVNTASGEAPALEDAPEQENVRDELPESRFAEIYLSRSGVQRLLQGRAGSATQLETFVDYGATQGMAAAAVAEDDGIKVELVSALNPKLLAKNPSFFSELPEFEPELTGEAGERTIAYVGAGEVGPTLTQLLEQAGGEGLGGSLRGLSNRLREEAGVDPLADLLPALGGQAALVAEPTEGVPFASLIVDDVDSERAAQALAQLQGPLLRALGNRGRVPRFEETEVDGTPVRSVQASPTVNLSYAVFDDKLVVSTSPEGIAQVRSDDDGLEDAEAFERATEDLPDEVSALVFINLDELFGQVTRTDLVEDPFFANLSVLFDNAASVALAVNADDEQIRSELFLALD